VSWSTIAPPPEPPRAARRPWESVAAPALLALGAIWLWVACASLPPRALDDLCGIFAEKQEWYDAALRAEQRWGAPLPVLMAVLHQESRFRARARPGWRTLFGVVPLGPASSAYGFGQVKNGTWDDYRRSTRRPGARRDHFEDAVDFVGWYADVIERSAGVAKDDPFNLYLAYHEGPTGFVRRSFEAKPWLQGVARKVKDRAGLYAVQRAQCAPAMTASR
jgi:hypothetical protein